MAKTHADDPDYFARKAAESEVLRRQIINEVARDAGPDDDIDYLTKRELYCAGIISASELHATGSPELLPRGWYQHYVEALDEYCPARVFSLEEAGGCDSLIWPQRDGLMWLHLCGRRSVIVTA